MGVEGVEQQYLERRHLAPEPPERRQHEIGALLGSRSTAIEKEAKRSWPPLCRVRSKLAEVNASRSIQDLAASGACHASAQRARVSGQ
jgi:hypothetical protein